MEMERKVRQTKADVVTETDGRMVTAIIAGIGNIDRQRDRIQPGAFTKTLAEKFTNQPKPRIKALFDHVWPIGVPTHMEEQSTGVLAVTRVSDIPKGNEMLTLIRDGVVDRASIGYRAVKFDTSAAPDGGKPIREIRELEMFEYSFLWLPANDETAILDVKSMLQDPNGLADLVTRCFPGTVAASMVAGLTPEKKDGIARVIQLSRELTDAMLALAGDREPPQTGTPASEPQSSVADEVTAIKALFDRFRQ